MKKRDIEDIKKILKDVREDKLFEPLTTEEKDRWKNCPKERLDLYLREKELMARDAERWPLAIESYKTYGCFSFTENLEPETGKYFVDSDYYVCYRKENNEIVRLSADLLTNVGAIKKIVETKIEKTKPEEQKIVDAFYTVGYTIGNFSLIWKNPGGPDVSDMCWKKLEKSGMYINKNGKLQRQERAHGLENRENIVNLRHRHEEDLFMILPSVEDPKEVMKKLYFQDYFDENWELKRRSQNVAKLERAKLLCFIKEITILIVQRSYRIIFNLKDDILEPEDQLNIKAVLREIGLSGVGCIHTPKRGEGRDCKKN